MAPNQNFRTAFNGFNREDVVRYIEFLNARHQTEVNQLKSELDFLRSKQSFSLTRSDNERKDNDADRIRELTGENQRLQAELTAAQTLKVRAEESMKAALDEKIAATAELESALRQRDSYKSRMEQELEAYRRAERAERLARERAEQLYRQANGVLADATVKVDEAAGQIGGLTDRVMEQLGQLQEAVTNSKQALRDAAATMYTIKPQDDRE